MDFTFSQTFTLNGFWAKFKCSVTFALGEMLQSCIWKWGGVELIRFLYNLIEPLTVRPWSYFGPVHYFPEMKDSPLLLCASPFNATLPLAPLKQQNIISNELYHLIFSNTEEHRVQAIYRTMHRIWSLMGLGLSQSQISWLIKQGNYSKWAGWSGSPWRTGPGPLLL